MFLLVFDKEEKQTYKTQGEFVGYCHFTLAQPDLDGLFGV